MSARFVLASTLGLTTSLLACTDGVRSGAPAAVDPVPAELRRAGTDVAVRFDGAGQLRWVTGTLPAAGATVETAARAFLTEHADLFELRGDGADLVQTSIRRGRSTTYVRFGQVVGGLPVFDREVIVGIDATADVALVKSVHLAHASRPTLPGGLADRGADAAVAAAMHAAGTAAGALSEPATRGLFASPAGAPLALAYRVRLAAVELGVDAASGAVLWRKARRVYADGTGLVFDPDPMSSSGDTYADNNDATSAALDAARFDVTLPRLDGTGVLRGDYADARPTNAASRASAAGLAFPFDRANNAFEEVMAYYHLDRAQDRITSTLGFVDVNHGRQVAIVNAFADDNSYYDPGNDTLNFGTGGVDDAEDAGIVLHEYGHAIQDDQVPGWGGGDEGSMGEGFGDYLAASFIDVLAPNLGDPACVGHWDAVGYDADCLRRVDGDKHYPEAADGEVHDDGEIWAAALWRARAALGADTMDTLVLEAHFLLSSSESFQAGADAILAADADLNGGANAAVLRRAFYAHGLSRDTLPGASYDGVESSDVVDLHNPRGGGGTYADNLDHTVTYSIPGATALRLHFDQIETELDGSCFDGACDNVYLFDGDGDLFQVLNGNRSNVDSVQIPGDTVQIRLVTDFSVGAFGYQVSRVDAMGGALLPDAAPGSPDAAWNGTDAGVARPDAGGGTDDATDGTDGTDGAATDGGGGCCGTGRGGDTGTALTGAGLLAVLLRRRRRRAAR